MPKIINSTKVLLVDDEPGITHAFSCILQKRGFEVQTALSVDSALSIIGEWLPDIVLSDYRLSDKTGGDFLQEIRDVFPELLSQIHFLLLTGNAGDVQRDPRCAGVQILQKPVRFSVLHEVILSLLFPKGPSDLTLAF